MAPCRDLRAGVLVTLLPLAIQLQNQHVHGSRVGYVGIALAAAASWAGLPGPGEAVLVTAAVVAAHGHLNLGPVLLFAWIGATAGGVAGWLVGLRAGRLIITAPGPLRHLRLAALEQGERLYDRFGLIAVFLTPSWMAGIHRMNAAAYLLANAVSAALWSLAFGLGGYLVGPEILEALGSVGLIGAIVFATAVVLGILLARRRRTRRRRTRGPGWDTTAVPSAPVGQSYADENGDRLRPPSRSGERNRPPSG